MQITAEHNLTPAELSKALHGIAEAEGIAEELVKALKKTGACDLTPKVPQQAAIRQIYDMLMDEFARAAADIERYAEEIAKGKSMVKSIEVHAHQRHFKDGHETTVSTFYRIGDQHGTHALTRQEADKLPHPYHFDAYHGTTETSAHGIVTNGFDVNKMRNGQLYGKGIYSTPNLQEAEFWAKHRISDGEVPTVLQMRIVAHSPVEIDRRDYAIVMSRYLETKHLIEQCNGNFERARMLALEYRRQYFVDQGHDVLILKTKKPDGIDFKSWILRHGGHQIIAFHKENAMVIK